MLEVEIEGTYLSVSYTKEMAGLMVAPMWGKSKILVMREQAGDVQRWATTEGGRRQVGDD